MYQIIALRDLKKYAGPLTPMFFPVLGALISGGEFQYPDNNWKELTGIMDNLVAKSGDNKGQFSPIVEAICRGFRQINRRFAASPQCQFRNNSELS